jgi:hypothetical protein
MADAKRAADELERLRRENQTLRHAVELLHRVANLVREALELEPTCTRS